MCEEDPHGGSARAPIDTLITPDSEQHQPSFWYFFLLSRSHDCSPLNLQLATMSERRSFLFLSLQVVEISLFIYNGLLLWLTWLPLALTIQSVKPGIRLVPPTLYSHSFIHLPRTLALSQ